MTEQRPIQPTPVGALRFNTDSAKLEYFDGNQYVNITTDSPKQNTGGTRGLWGGGGPSATEPLCCLAWIKLPKSVALAAIST